MNDAKLQALLSGYAAGTLTSEEQQALYALALEKQDVFDALFKEQPLREVLEDSAIRGRLLNELSSPVKQRPWAVKNWKWLGSGAVALLAASVAISIWIKHQSPAVTYEARVDIPVRHTPDTPESEAVVQPKPEPPIAAKRAVPLPKAAPPPAPPVQAEKPTFVLKQQSLPRDSAKAEMPVPPPPPAATPPPPQEPPQIAIAMSPIATAGSPHPPEIMAQSTKAEYRSGNINLHDASPAALFMSRWAPRRGAAKLVAVPPSAGLMQGALASRIDSFANTGSAIRVSLHPVGKTAQIDWRTNSSDSLVLNVDTTARGYIAVIEVSDQPKTLYSAAEPAAANTSVSVPLNREETAKLIIVFSPSPISPARIPELANAQTSPTDEVHAQSNHALYGATGPSGEILVRLTLPAR